MSLFQVAQSFAAGGIAGLATVVLMHVGHNVLKVEYLTASTIAFCVGVLLNFTLQKVFVFRLRHARKVGLQFVQFLFAGLVNIIVNLVAMYALVSLVGIHYVISQTIVVVALGFANYAAYKLIFRS